ncbi:response regulator [Halioxenophilus sp. WMMB6]|uniref:response regulator n=1 Tax=Halioxenophilus sp. WMMB6 TaxID=3073815 RepID=UPI00295E74C0|nr:response regulator [Halioxenophilus sp. WMMB6]
MSSAPVNILLVEDDRRLAELTQRYLQQHHYHVTVEHHGDRALHAFSRCRPDLILLDIMLPGMDGLALCSRLKQQYTTPIILLTARDTHMDEVVGLETGADDYLSKPVEPMVLLARIRNLLKRQQPAQREPIMPAGREIELGELRINRFARAVWYRGRPVTLSTQEYDLLLFLVINADCIMNRDDLMKQIRGIEYDGLDRTVDVYISRLRKAFDDDPSSPSKIKTVWGKGYLLARDAW